MEAFEKLSREEQKISCSILQNNMRKHLSRIYKTYRLLKEKLACFTREEIFNKFMCKCFIDPSLRVNKKFKHRISTEVPDRGRVDYKARN